MERHRRLHSEGTRVGLTVIYSGGKEIQRGVAVILNESTGRNVIKVIQHSGRLMLAKLKAEPVDTVIVQVYLPTTGHSDDEQVEVIYEQMNELIDEGKGNDYLVVMGGWNAILGETRDDKEVGEFRA